MYIIINLKNIIYLKKKETVKHNWKKSDKFGVKKEIKKLKIYISNQDNKISCCKNNS